MNVESIIDRNITAASTKVRVTDVPSAISDSAVADYAMAAANESRSSLWGFNVTRNKTERTATVFLHTD